MRSPAFWDTSALVPLCVRQAVTPRVRELYALHDVVVWWAALVEIASAPARLMRLKQLEFSDWNKARKLAKKLADSWSVIQPSDALRAMATQLVERHDLQAADSIQLAAALEWCEHLPQARIFLTADQKLRQAGLLSGFDAKSIEGREEGKG